MKEVVRLISLFLAFFSMSGIVYANTTMSMNEKQADVKNTQALFVMISKAASIHKTDKPGIYKLVLKGINPKAVYFSNHPQRLSGQISIEKLITQWTNGTFKNDAPNAVIEAVSHNLKTKKRQSIPNSYAVVLTHPDYSLQHKDELSFEVKSLPGSNAALLPTMIHSDYVAIFIDDVCLSCIG